MEKTETRTEADPAQRLERLAINTDGVILDHNYGDNPYLTVEPTKGDAVEIRLANHQWIVQTGTIKGPENYELGVNKASYENYLKARRAFEFRVEDLKAIRLMTNKKRSDDRNLNWMYGPQLPDSGTATLRTTWWHIHPQNGYAIDAHENPEWHVKIRNSSRCRPEWICPQCGETFVGDEGRDELIAAEAISIHEPCATSTEIETAERQEREALDAILTPPKTFKEMVEHPKAHPFAEYEI